MAIKEIHYQGNIFEINYTIINPKNKKNFIVLHGWGSNKELMLNAFKNILPHHKHIYIDMPGFGKSSNPVTLTTHDYQGIMQLFLDTLKVDKDVIAGHSFGGKVATLLQPDLLVLLSSAGIKEDKPLGVKVKITLFKLFKIFGLGHLRKYFAAEDGKNMSQNMYETFKNVVDEDFSQIFTSYKGKTLLFWGKSDTATKLSSGKRITKLIVNSTMYSYDGDHYFFMKHAPEIGHIITEEIHGTL